jgi:hypothetical protein
MLLNELFGQLDEVGGVGVVAANKRMARDPRYSMSMTQDIKPGETQKQAKKFGNSVDKMGMPPVAKTNGQIAEAAMSTSIQARNPISAGARGLMNARWKYQVPALRAENANTNSAVDILASRLPNLEKVDYQTIDMLMKDICNRTNMTPDQLHRAFVHKFKLTPDSYAANVKHARNNKPKSV